MASVIHTKGVQSILKNDIDPDVAAFKALLTSDSYAPNGDTHDFRDSVTNELAASGGYVAGGFAVTVSVSRDDANNRVDITFSGFTVDPATFSASKVVYYRARGGASSADELIFTLDLANKPIVASGGAWTVTASILRFQLP